MMYLTISKECATSGYNTWLSESEDLINWKQERIIIAHPDIQYHGVQYVDWQFEGEDIVAVIRAAWEDGEGNTLNQHDSNYILFRRIEKYDENR